MSLFDAVLLGLLQGLTEFLPVSSSGHLILGESLLGLDVSALAAFDVAVHFGTLAAILFFFRKDFLELVIAFICFFRGEDAWKKGWGGISGEDIREKKKLVIYLVLATLPAIVVGLAAADWLEEVFRSPRAVAWMMLFVAAYFVAAEQIGKRMSKKKVEMKEIGLGRVMLIGVAQAVALIPGVSRSGSTISTGIAMGLDRREAARFSFLLGSIAILAATTLSIYKISKGEMILPSWEIMVMGIVSAGLSGYAAIAFMLKFLKNHTLYVFAAYLILLAITTLMVGL